MYFDLESFLDRFVSFTDFCSHKIVYPVLIILTGLVGYFAMMAINALPKPETISELFNYLLYNHEDYFSALGLTLVAFVSTAFLGFGTMGFGIKFDELHIAFRIIFGILGVAIIVSGFFFFSYFLKLLFVLVLIGFFAIALVNDSGSSKRRRRY